MTLIDGKEVSERCKEEIKTKIRMLDKTPGLAVIRIGEDEASKIYVRLKHKMCEELGIQFVEHHLEESITQEELISLIKNLNQDDFWETIEDRSQESFNIIKDLLKDIIIDKKMKLKRIEIKKNLLSVIVCIIS